MSFNKGSKLYRIETELCKRMLVCIFRHLVSSLYFFRGPMLLGAERT